jgi:type II secretory pathway component GspD/PulD (secretin)
MKRIILTLWAVLLMVAVVHAEQAAPATGGGDLERHGFEVLPTLGERVREMFGEEMPLDAALKAAFAEFGVTWPQGSSIKYVPVIGKLFVVNTAENISKSEEVINSLRVVPCQIEIEVQYSEFDLSDIDAIARQGKVIADALNALRQKGKARLVHAPRVVTQSGSEATVKGMRECIYPTAFTVVATSANLAAHGSVSEPGAFETREVGVILQVLPELTPDGSMICLTLTPQVVDEPEWKDYGSTYVDSKGKEQKARMEVPFFHTSTVTTSICLKDGANVLIGGGMPSKDPSKVVYVFVMARRVGLDGKPLSFPAPEPAK